MTQMAKLFAPKWRRTVILMWIIWGSMSFCKSIPRSSSTPRLPTRTQLIMVSLYDV
jgi:hypothetical protein